MTPTGPGWIWIAIVATLLTGCGSDESSTLPAQQNSDAATDSGSEAGADALGEAAPDSGPDAWIESGSDTAPDAPQDDPTCASLPPSKVIALWDVVPLQVFSPSIRVGVVAFHEEGVEVSFSVDGNPVGTVDVPSLNPDTGVVEYWVELQAEDYADGPIHVTAKAVSDCPGHIDRDLAELVLHANHGGTLTNSTVKWADCAAGSDSTGDGTEAKPYVTIEKALVEVGEGGTVQLKAGTCYAITDDLPAANYTRWTTIQAAPGVTRDAVKIRGEAEAVGATGRFGEDMIRWKGVSIYKDSAAGWGTIFYFESGHKAWLDGAELYDARGMANGGQIAGGNEPYELYATDAYVHDIQNVMLGFSRGVLAENIGSDVVRGGSNTLIVNLTVKTIDAGATDAHPDFVQFYNPSSTVENLIVYNAKVTNMGAQGLFGGPGQMRDIAFVNLLMEKDPSDSALISQFSGDWDHVLLWHVTTVDSGMLIRDEMLLKHVYVWNNSLAGMSGYDNATLKAAFWNIDHNQFAGLSWDQTEPLGTNAIVSPQQFTDEPTDDYRPAAGAPAVHAGVPIAGVPTDLDNKPYDPSHPSLGAYELP
jgi:hypothetical protein